MTMGKSVFFILLLCVILLGYAQGQDAPEPTPEPTLEPTPTNTSTPTPTPAPTTAQPNATIPPTDPTNPPNATAVPTADPTPANATNEPTATPNPTPAPAPCGDGICSATENCVICPIDCKSPCGLCGDGTCSASENCTICPTDCECDSSNKCHNNCHGHGDCVRGVCVCRGNYAGIDCELMNHALAYHLNDSAPNAVVMPSTASNVQKFDIRVATIGEITGGDDVNNSTIVTAYEIKPSNITQVIEKATSQEYHILLPNNVNVVVVFQYSLVNSTRVFANKTILLPRYTLSLNVSLDKWPFQSVGNKLFISVVSLVEPLPTTVVAAEDEHSPKSDCNHLPPYIRAKQVDETGVVQWIQVSQGPSIMYGRMHPWALVDNIPKRALYHWGDDFDIQITMPYYVHKTAVNMDFGIQINEATESNQATDKCVIPLRDLSGTKGAIAGIVIAIGVALIGFCVFVVKSRRVAPGVRLHDEESDIVKL